jgi:hypothetical protein
MIMNKRTRIIVVLMAAFLAFTHAAMAQRRGEAVNYFYESGAWLDISDSVGDDKGPGYYQYPQDRRMRRGTFDLKRFVVYEEGNVVVFEIQMRNYIMREWPDTSKSEDQGFVANLWDIYIDIDGRENSGYKAALPGRDLLFRDNMGWEKVIMITPLSEYELFDILRNKTDELDFQNSVEDIVYPDYVKVQRDRVIIKISKVKLPGISEKSGYQCLAMGYKKIVSPNRLLNRDVRGFSTYDDFGGGHDTYGDPPVIDIIVPEGEDQYKILRDFRSEPYRENISYASVPFVYAGGKSRSQIIEKPVVKEPAIIPANQSMPTTTLATQPPKIIKPAVPVARTGNQNKNQGFVPLKPVSTKNENGFKPVPKAPDGFIPVKKKE